MTPGSGVGGTVARREFVPAGPCACASGAKELLRAPVFPSVPRVLELDAYDYDYGRLPSDSCSLCL